MGTGNGGGMGVSFGPEIEIDSDAATPDPSKYIEGDGQVVIDIWNSLSGVVVTIDLRLLLPSGIVVPNEWVVTPTSDRTKNTSQQSVSEGFVLTCTARAPSGTMPGATFVRVSITRGSPVSGVKSIVLLQGYAGNQNELTYPNGTPRQSNDGRGRIRSITGTAPGAGAEINEVVPTGACWRLLAMLCSFITSATVANRVPHLAYNDGSNNFFLMNWGFNITASKAQNISAGVGFAYTASFDSAVAMPLLLDVVLPAGFRFKTVTDSLQSGDQYSAPQYVVEEWISP